MTQQNFPYILRSPTWEELPLLVDLLNRCALDVKGTEPFAVEGTERVLFTRVYAQPSGQWQVVTSQATPIA